MRRFLEWFRPGEETRILDIGGLPRFWADVSIPARITLLNLYPLDEYDRSFLAPSWTSVVGDGTHLDYADNEFDIVFSNSVIEHLGTQDNRRPLPKRPGGWARVTGSKHRQKSSSWSRTS